MHKKNNERVEVMILAKLKSEKNVCTIPIDYIVGALLHGSGFENGKKRIYKMYQTIPSKKDRTSAIRKEYGTGGCGWPLDGYGMHGYDYDGKGIKIQWRDENGEHDGLLSWSQVEKYIGILISNGDYYCPIVTSDVDVWFLLFKAS